MSLHTGGRSASYEVVSCPCGRCGRYGCCRTGARNSRHGRQYDPGVLSITSGGEELVYEGTIKADGDPIWKFIETDGTEGTIIITEHLWVGEGPSLTD